MGWLTDVLGGITQGFAGGSFGGSIASGAMGLAGSVFKQGVGNKIYGMPEPKVGGPAGIDRFEYMNKAFPGTTALERLGGASQGPGNAVQAGKQQAKSQRRAEQHQDMMQSKQIASNEKIAGATLLQKKTEFTQGTLVLNEATIKQMSANTQKILAQTKAEIQRIAQLYHQTRSEAYKANLLEEVEKYKKTLALNGVATSAPKLYNWLGIGQMAWLNGRDAKSSISKTKNKDWDQLKQRYRKQNKYRAKKQSERKETKRVSDNIDKEHKKMKNLHSYQRNK